MTTRTKILAGMSAGALWAVLVVWLPGLGPQPFIPINLALIYAFVPGGLVLMALIARVAHRRFAQDDLIDGQDPVSGVPMDIDQKVLANTVEQMVLALLLWPFAMTTLGAVTIIWMGLAMAVARVAFWIGYHVSPPLRAFGFAASFYPTVLATFWTIFLLVT